MNIRNSTAAAAMPRSRALGTAVAAALGLLAAHGALAQESKSTLDDVIVAAPRYVPESNVTATKMDVPLIETPQSISVITRDQVDLLNMQNVSQAVRYSAGILGENYGADERYDWLTLRGFVPVQYVDGLQAPVGNPPNVGLDLWGFESVEILKGPASALYGSAPPGGIVNLTSRRPQSEFGGELQAQYGRYDHKQLAGDVTGPLGDKFAYRLTALWRDRGTQMDFVDSERIYVAPALTWSITDATKITFLGYWQDDVIDGDGGGFLPAEGVVLPNPNGRIPTSFNVGEPGYNTYQREQFGAGWDVSHDFGNGWSLQQNAKYSSSDVKFLSVYGAGLQADLRTLNRFNFPFFENIDSLATDTRLAGEFTTGGIEHDLLVGVDWRRYWNQSAFAFALGPTLDIFAPVYGTPVSVPSPVFPNTEQEQKQRGIYVQEHAKAGKWVFTLTGRHDEVKNTNFTTETKDDEFSYRAGVNYLFDSGFAPYVSYGRSFQPVYGADFNGNAFEPSIGKQFEAGVKFEPRNLAGRGSRALLTLAVFELTQENVLTPDPDPTHLFFNVQTGEVEVKGLELEGVARFNEVFSLNGSYTYTDSEVTKSNGPDLGKQLTQVPKHKLSLLGEYTFQSGALAGLGFSAGVRYVGESYGDTANEWRTPSVTLFDANLRYDWQGWRLALNGSNIFDKEYLSRCSSGVQCFYGLRRNVTFSVSRRLAL